jgi:hypothetical protein
MSISYTKSLVAAGLAIALFFGLAAIAYGQTAGRLDVASQTQINNANSASNYALLRITHDVINDNGGTDDEDDFIFTIDGMTAETGTTYVLTPGYHKITERGERTSGREYVTAWSANCPMGDVVLSAGQNVTCAVVNNDLAAEIIPNGVGGTDFIVDDTPGLGRGGAGGTQAMTTLLLSLVAVAALLSAPIALKRIAAAKK